MTTINLKKKCSHFGLGESVTKANRFFFLLLLFSTKVYGAEGTLGIYLLVRAYIDLIQKFLTKSNGEIQT